jgi:cellulose synthase/poly-beta-1,6-N-acetylglucosamine synthase-like glycosyltransferase
MTTLVTLLLGLLQAVLVFCLGYHYLLVLASIRQPRVPAATSAGRLRFAIAIPAHNESSVLSATLTQLLKQEYPRDLYDVHVVADHCSDNTAEVVRQHGGVVHERDSQPRGRKAYALQWLLERLLDMQPAYDAVAIFDADSMVDPQFLAIMASQLRAGRQVLQGQHLVSNPQDSVLAAIAAVDMRLNNRLRNQSRSNLGLSCRLMGDAMVFDAGILRDHGWPRESMTEDREYGYELLMRGSPAHYVPHARSYGQAASSWKQAEPQRLRWYQGVVGMQRRLAARLLSAVQRSPSLSLLDGLVELLMPGYSFLAALSVANLGFVLLCSWLQPSLRCLLGLPGSLLLLAGWVLYPLAGLVIDRAPVWAYRALMLGPIYLGWRLWIALLVRLRGDRIGWVRTQRREESDQVAT